MKKSLLIVGLLTCLIVIIGCSIVPEKGFLVIVPNKLTLEVSEDNIVCLGITITYYVDYDDKEGEDVTADIPHENYNSSLSNTDGTVISEVLDGPAGVYLFVDLKEVGDFAEGTITVTYKKLVEIVEICVEKIERV